MTYALIRKLLEVQLNTVGGTFPTAFENAPFTPQAGTPWQAVSLLPGQTSNPTRGDAHKREVGVMQVTLCYPTKTGAQALMARAEVLRSGFARGLSLVEGAVTVKILRSPFVGPATNDGSWYKVPLSVPYEADVF